MGGMYGGPSWNQLGYTQRGTYDNPFGMQQQRYPTPSQAYMLAALSSHAGTCKCAYCGRKRAADDLKKCESCGAPPR
jgi:hypothetical protein